MGGLIPFNILLLFRCVFHVLLSQSDRNDTFYVLRRTSASPPPRTHEHQGPGPDGVSSLASPPLRLSGGCRLSPAHFCPEGGSSAHPPGLLLLLPPVRAAPLVPAVLVFGIFLPHRLAPVPSASAPREATCWGLLSVSGLLSTVRVGSRLPPPSPSAGRPASTSWSCTFLGRNSPPIRTDPRPGQSCRPWLCDWGQVI
ncbi:hypothetical protein HJG60_009261 [Phyllostomus discolor]|uniref:Uncharacterized protein n=1 Tax=Phyllostomus discolor TaxID=89673 RepID=A0A833YMP0_9CHIR|nr:hypothetical protein HJG60_009261 [Phyllostomus discolor]